MKASALARFEELHQRSCPRVILDPDNYDAADLLHLLVADSPAFTGHFDDLTEGASAEERVELRRRILHVSGNPGYLEAREETMARLRREAEAKRGGSRPPAWGRHQ